MEMKLCEDVLAAESSIIDTGCSGSVNLYLGCKIGAFNTESQQLMLS